jgi:hypothetical protein
MNPELPSQTITRNLILAAYLGLESPVKTILKTKGIDPNACDYVSGFSAMECAATRSHGSVVSILDTVGATGQGISEIQYSKAEYSPRPVDFSMILPLGYQVMPVRISGSRAIAMSRKYIISVNTAREENFRLISYESLNSPVIIYDTGTRRNWSVPELHVISRMAHTYLDKRKNHLNDGYPSPSLEDVISEIWHTLERFRDAQHHEEAYGLGDKLVGYEFTDVENIRRGEYHRKEIKINDWPRPPWWDFRDDCVVLFARYT